jgi:hypothetical protein
MANQSTFPASYLLLQQEGYLISACLGAGLTNLRAANVHNKGAFYSALFNLSVGIERLMKALIIIEHMMNNGLSVPSKKQLKGYGHNLIGLYDRCVSIAQKRNVDFSTRQSLEPLQRELLDLLSDFAETARYHNLDALSPSHAGKDPLAHWSEILLVIMENDVPKRQKAKMLKQSRLVALAIDDLTITLMHGLDKTPLSTEEALALPGLHEHAAKYAVLHVVNILVPLRHLSSKLSYLAYTLKSPAPPFPQMHEFILWLSNDRQDVLRKKRWP